MTPIDMGMLKMAHDADPELTAVYQDLAAKYEDALRLARKYAAQADAYQMAMLPLKALMNGAMPTVVPEDVTEPTAGENPFPDWKIGYHIYEVMRNGETWRPRAVYHTVQDKFPCSFKGVQNALYNNPGVFEKVAAGQFRLAEVGR